MFEHSADLMGVAGLDGYFQIVNPAFCSTLGYNADELKAIPYLDLLHPADRSASTAELQRLQKGENVLQFSNRFRCKDGSFKWISWTATSAPDEGLFYAVGRDITDSQQSLDALLSDLPGMVYRRLNDADWTLSFVSRGCVEVTGYSSEAFMDDATISFDSLVHPDDRARHHDELHSAMEEQREFQVEYRIITADGTEKVVWEKGRAIDNGDGGFVTLQGYIVDITDQRKLRDELAQLQKMESLGQLTGGIAHDFNNLLTVVIGNLQLLESRVTADAQSMEMVDDALETAWRGADLCQRLLAFGRRQMLDPVAVNVNALVTDMEKLVRRTIKEKIEIELSLEPELAEVTIDRGQLENALLNLAINARDAMPEGGILYIRTQTFTADEEYADVHPDAVVGDYAVIEVSDTGIGMPSSLVKRAFEPFFTTKEAGKGTGLGLSMVYGLLKQSGGYARIYSEVGHGTSVKIYIPVPDNARPDEARTVRAMDRMPTGTERVLVVEDDDAVRKVVVRTLTELGYRTIEADSGAAALECLSGAGQDVDLLFTDVVMPGRVDGVVLAAQAVRNKPDLKVLLTSGFSRQHVGSRGTFTLLSKPYSKLELAGTIRKVLDS